MRHASFLLSFVLFTACGDDSGPAGARDAGADTGAGTDGGGDGVDAGPGADAGPGEDGGILCEPLSLASIGTFDDPMGVTAPAGDARLFIHERKAGRIVIVADGAPLATPFLDIAPRVGIGGARDNEPGLLGLAFHPDYTTNGFFFVSYTNTSVDLVVSRFTVSAADANVADGTTERILMTVPLASTGHISGHLAFGGDGLLYVGVGDDSRAANAQDDALPTGKIHRIDVDVATPAPEVFAKGVRVPWRFSFDPMTGDLYLGDVGDRRYEEIDFLPSGTAPVVNLGWPTVEGNGHCHTPVVCDPAGITMPIHEETHPGFSAMMAGYVYRGASPCNAGRFFYGDYVSGDVKSLLVVGGAATDVRDEDALSSSSNIVSFGRDGMGELYVLYQSGGISRFE